MEDLKTGFSSYVGNGEKTIPEVTDGVERSGKTGKDGFFVQSFCSERLSAGTWELNITIEATEDIRRLYLFTGRKQLREILSMKKGECFTGVYDQSLAEIIPRYHSEEILADRLFWSYAAENLEAVKIVTCFYRKVEIPVLYLAGDSTVTDQMGEIPYMPGAVYSGWGQCLPAFMADPVAVENQAHCGLTTETFRDEGHWEIVKRHLKPGDFCLFQFGHNDQKVKHLLADREYPVNLRRYIRETDHAGAHPVLVTPLSRNIWIDGAYQGLLEEHAQAVRDVAKEEGVPCIDLHEESKRWIMEGGESDSMRYFHPGDHTHTNDFGAYRGAAWIFEELQKLYPCIFWHTKRMRSFLPERVPLDMEKKQQNRFADTGQKEHFDAMEKSKMALLEAINQAKK